MKSKTEIPETKDLVDMLNKAEEVYELGIKMQGVFAKTDTDKRHFMILAIAAGLKQYSSSAKLTSIDELAKIRKEKGLTLRQIEHATGISSSYLSQLENGKISKPSMDVMTRLTNFIIRGISFIEPELTTPNANQTN